MNKSLNRNCVAIGHASPAVAQPGPALAATRAQQFASEVKTLEQESTRMPVGSAQVNKHERAADPLPKATAYANKAAAFASQERLLQQQATP